MNGGEAGTRRQRAARSSRTTFLLVLLVILFVALAYLARSGAPATPLDPSSPAPDGLLGLVMLLEDLDVEVVESLGPPPDTSTRVFVPIDLLDAERADELIRWNEGGGTLVVGGRRGRLHDLDPVPLVIGDAFGTSLRTPECDDPAVAHVVTVEHGDWADHVVDPEATGCFVAETGGAWMVSRARGDGRLVVLGSSTPFTNRWLDHADHAILATALLAPEPGARTSIVPRPPPGSGDSSLLELVPVRVWEVAGVLLLAVAVWVAARSRRLGSPVVEKLPPVLPSSEWVVSLANLSHRARDVEGSAAHLRERARHVLGDALGLGPAAASPVIIDRAIQRLAIERDTVELAVGSGHRVEDEDDLVRLAGAVACIERAAGASLPSEGAGTPDPQPPSGVTS